MWGRYNFKDHFGFYEHEGSFSKGKLNGVGKLTRDDGVYDVGEFKDE